MTFTIDSGGYWKASSPGSSICGKGDHWTDYIFNLGLEPYDIFFIAEMFGPDSKVLRWRVYVQWPWEGWVETDIVFQSVP